MGFRRALLESQNTPCTGMLRRYPLRCGASDADAFYCGSIEAHVQILVANATVAEGVPLGVTPPGKLAAELIPWWITERWQLLSLS